MTEDLVKNNTSIISVGWPRNTANWLNFEEDKMFMYSLTVNYMESC